MNINKPPNKKSKLELFAIGEACFFFSPFLSENSAKFSWLFCPGIGHCLFEDDHANGNHVQSYFLLQLQIGCSFFPHTTKTEVTVIQIRNLLLDKAKQH